MAGIALTTLYAPNGWIGKSLMPLGIKVAYMPLGIVVALMQEQGNGDEEAALSLSVNGWTFWYVTLPNVIRGLTNTMPLHVETLYNEYNAVGAFAVASLLAA